MSHKKKIILAGVVVVAAAVGIYIWMQSKKKTALQQGVDEAVNEGAETPPTTPTGEIQLTDEQKAAIAYRAQEIASKRKGFGVFGKIPRAEDFKQAYQELYG